MRWSLLRALGRSRSEEAPELVVMGLGNPGPEYARTRHNAGWWCVDLLAERHDVAMRRRHRLAIVGFGEVEGRPVALAKPRTYVNGSGLAARYLLDRYHVEPSSLLVVCDDMALPPGRVRLRPRGSHGGHRGLRSIIETLGTQDFPRLRIGIGRPSPEEDVVDYVLGEPPRQEMVLLREAVERAAEAVVCVLTDGLQQAMNRFN